MKQDEKGPLGSTVTFVWSMGTKESQNSQEADSCPYEEARRPDEVGL